MNKENFSFGNKNISLYLTDTSDKLVVLNAVSDCGEEVLRECKNLNCNTVNLLVVSGLDWNSDMTPWRAEPFSPTAEPYGGKADEYLEMLTGEILPKAFEIIGERPKHLYIAGYSLAGLFALYSLYSTDMFDGVASVSGSLWYPEFTEFIESTEFKKHPERIYISLGDKEAKTKNRLMRTVADKTDEAVEYYRHLGVDVLWEQTKGNHFTDAAKRTAKGIYQLTINN